MYCSSCGTSVSPDLSYCNRCGAVLNASDLESSEKLVGPQESLVFFLIATTILGIGAVIGLMAVMKEVVHFSNELILPLTLLTFLIILGVDSVIVYLLLRRTRKAGPPQRSQQKELITNQLRDRASRELPEPSFNITDHTTHTLEPAVRKRQSE